MTEATATEFPPISETEDFGLIAAAFALGYADGTAIAYERGQTTGKNVTREKREARSVIALVDLAVWDADHRPPKGSHVTDQETRDRIIEAYGRGFAVKPTAAWS